MNRIVYSRPDGGVSVIVPAPNYRLAGESDEKFIARIMAKDVPTDATDVAVCDEADIPTDRTFRNAWERGGKSVVVNMPKAREIHMARIRARRNELLDASDKELARAQETGGDVRAIQARRQALRDVPQSIQAAVEAAQTPDSLKHVWPEILS
jgi:hypothetical protein